LESRGAGIYARFPSCSVGGEEVLYVSHSLQRFAVGIHLGRDLVPPASLRGGSTIAAVGRRGEGDGGTAADPSGGTVERGAAAAALLAFSETGRVATKPAAAPDGEAGLLAEPWPEDVPPPLGVQATVCQEDAIPFGGDGREVGSPTSRGANGAVADKGRAVVFVVSFFIEGYSWIARTALLLDDEDWRRRGGRTIGDGRGARSTEGGGRLKDSGGGGDRHIDTSDDFWMPRWWCRI
jgi:hypothetical protein